MITSIEPGLYRPGQWGIRIENLVLNVPAAVDGPEFGEFLEFEMLTLCPIDTRCIERALLRASDLDGSQYEIEAEGWFARILQHEYDHLNGIIYADRLEHPWYKDAFKVMRKRSWGGPGKSWLPGVDDLEG